MAISSYPTDEDVDLAITELRDVCRLRIGTLASLDVIAALPSKWWVKRVNILLDELDGLMALAENHRG